MQPLPNINLQVPLNYDQDPIYVLRRRLIDNQVRQNYILLRIENYQVNSLVREKLNQRLHGLRAKMDKQGQCYNIEEGIDNSCIYASIYFKNLQLIYLFELLPMSEKNMQSEKRNEIGIFKVGMIQQDENFNCNGSLQVSLLKKKLIFLQAFTNSLINQQVYLIQIPDIQYIYDSSFDLIRGRNNSSWNKRGIKMNRQYDEINKKLEQTDQMIDDRYKKINQIQKQITKEEDQQIKHFYQNQIQSIQQYLKCLDKVQQKLITIWQPFSQIVVESLTQNINKKTENQNLSIVQSKKQFLEKQEKLKNNLQKMEMISQQIRKTKIKDKTLVQQYQKYSTENQMLIGQQTFIQIKKQSYISYYNYPNKYQKLKFEQYIKQFYNINVQLLQNQKRIEYTIEKIRKFKEGMINQQDENFNYNQSSISISNFERQHSLSPNTTFIQK